MISSQRPWPLDHEAGQSGKMLQDRKSYNNNRYNLVIGTSKKNVIRAIKKEDQMVTACGNFWGEKKC